MNGFLLIWGGLALTAMALALVVRHLYLVVLAVALGAAALMADRGAMLPTQLAALLGLAGLGIYVLNGRRGRRRADPSRDTDQDGLSVMPEQGREVHIFSWEADRHTTVLYRGQIRQAKLAPDQLLRHGVHRVREDRGDVLILEYLHP